MPFLPPNQQRQSTEGRSKHSVHSTVISTVLILQHTHTHNYFTALCTLYGTTRVSWYQKVHIAIFWIFWWIMKITQADTPTIQMYCHPILTDWCPRLCHPHHFYARCPSWHNPPNLSWLGTAPNMLVCVSGGLVHTRWLGFLYYSTIYTIVLFINTVGVGKCREISHFLNRGHHVF